MAKYRFRTLRTQASEVFITASSYDEAEDEFRAIFPTLEQVTINEDTEVTEYEGMGESAVDEYWWSPAAEKISHALHDDDDDNYCPYPTKGEQA